MLNVTVRTTGASLRRAVGFLLVVFVFYGTTVEAAHRHGNLLPTANSIAASVTSPHTSTINSTKVNCNDCLICQLHQNSSASLISVRDTPRPTVTRPQFSIAIQKNFLSEISSPGSGRAPPLTF